jgi:hypothetical protein
VKSDDILTNDLLFSLFKTRMERLRELDNYWNSMKELSKLFKIALTAYTCVSILFKYSRLFEIESIILTNYSQMDSMQFKPIIKQVLLLNKYETLTDYY